MNKVAIIGGGAGGICAALELAKYGIDITILEASDKILNRTSARTPGRLGLGFHYPVDNSLETARTIICAAIELKRYFPKAILADQQPSKSYLGKGWYFITKNSQQPAEEFIKYCCNIQQIYAEECQKRNYNAYGAPENFFRILALEEYKDLVNVNNVAIGIETSEGILNWSIMAQEILDKLAQYSNIRVLTHHRVVNIQPQDEKFKITVVLPLKRPKEMLFDIIINASCEYRLLLDQLVGYTPKIPWSNRLKLLAKVSLPPELVSQHSMFFAQGPFAMFTNIGDGTGFTTYAPITNSNTIDASEPFPVAWEKMITKGLEPTVEQEIGSAIINGIANYIPIMRKSRLIKVVAGIVHHQGTANIYSPQSDIHQRRHTGIYNYAPGYYSLDTGKLCFAPYYGRILSEMIMHYYNFAQVGMPT